MILKISVNLFKITMENLVIVIANLIIKNVLERNIKMLVFLYHLLVKNTIMITITVFFLWRENVIIIFKIISVSQYKIHLQIVFK